MLYGNYDPDKLDELITDKLSDVRDEENLTDEQVKELEEYVNESIAIETEWNRHVTKEEDADYFDLDGIIAAWIESNKDPIE